MKTEELTSEHMQKSESKSVQANEKAEVGGLHWTKEGATY
jgi:hypothetical protein